MTLRQRLLDGPVVDSWLAELAAVAVPDVVAVPSGTELMNILYDLAVPAEDIDAILRLRPRLTLDRELSLLLAQTVSVLSAGMGQVGREPALPPLSDGSDPLINYFYVYVYAALFPAVYTLHADRGIDADVTRRTLADLGRQLTHNRRRLGYGGFNLNTDWLAGHFQGRLFQLGRLQFETVPLGTTTGHEVRAGGQPYGPGDPAVAVHIPDYCGPFEPAQCDESFRLARAFFEQHLPDWPAGVLTCHSWLLDPQLAGYLSPDSNIIAFQRQFTINQRDRPHADDTFFQAVFGRPAQQLDALPQDSTLQRALVRHLRDGGHWYEGVGWRPL